MARSALPGQLPISLPPARGRVREGGTAKRFLSCVALKRLRRLPPIPAFPLKGGRCSIAVEA